MGIKFISGSFEVTDNKGAFSLKGYVVVEKITKPLFLISINSFHGDNSPAMAFSAIEARTLGNYLTNFFHNKESKYEKISGGKNIKKTLTIEIKNKYFAIIILAKNIRYETIIPLENMIALGQEITLLVDESVKNSYKTEQYIERGKKNKNE